MWGKSKGSKKRALRIYFATDLHGSEVCFRKFLAAERLDPAVRCIITPGNDDPVDADAVLAAHGRVECPELELCDLGPVTMASLGVVPTTPWDTERECTEEELAKQIDEMLGRLPGGRPSIL